MTTDGAKPRPVRRISFVVRVPVPLIYATDELWVPARDADPEMVPLGNPDLATLPLVTSK